MLRQVIVGCVELGAIELDGDAAGEVGGVEGLLFGSDSVVVSLVVVLPGLCCGLRLNLQKNGFVILIQGLGKILLRYLE